MNSAEAGKTTRRQIVPAGGVVLLHLAPVAQGTLVTQIAKGSYTVQMKPQLDPVSDEGVSLGRLSLKKRFDGDLVGTGTGELLTALTPIKGSAGYVAIERISGRPNGRAPAGIPPQAASWRSTDESWRARSGRALAL